MAMFLVFVAGTLVGGIAGIIYAAFNKDDELGTYEPDFTWG